MSESQLVYDCIIVGAGISGLSFAHYLSKENQKVLVLEKENECGGQIKTWQSADSDFWCELGAHTCYNMYSNLLSIVKDLSADSEVFPMQNRSYMMYASGRLKSVFSQLSLSSMATHCLKILGNNKKGKTVREYFEPVVGARNYCPLFSNLFRAVISQNADDYPAELFLKKRKNRMGEFPHKYTFQKGIGALLDAIVERNRLSVQYGTSAISVSLVDSLYAVSANDGIYYAKNIAFATDPQTAGRLAKEIDSDVSGTLSSIELSHTESFGVIVEKDSISFLKEIAGIVPMNDDFFSVVARDAVSHLLYRGFTFHFGEGRYSLEEQLDTVCKVLAIDKNQIIEYSTTRHVLPSLRMKDVNVADSINAHRNAYFLGNYFFGLSLEDCVHRSLVEYERYKSNLAK